MALDGFFLSSLVRNLSEDLIGKKVEKIAQPEKDEIILYFKINRKNKGLLISSSSNYPRIHFTGTKKENPLKPPMFCMVLRKYLKGAKIQSIEQISTDRILKINFLCFDELGFESEFSLMIEIMGRHSNISLVRVSDNIIMDCIKHITPAKNSFRSIMSGVKYIYPPKSEFLNPYDFDSSKLEDKLASIDDLHEKSFSKVFTGFSGELSKEMFYRLDKKLDNCNSSSISNRVESIIESFKKESDSFNLYTVNGSVKTFHCIKLNHLLDIGYSSNPADNGSELLENYYFKKDLQDRMHNKTSDISRLVSTNIDRCEKKIKILNNTISDSHKKDKYRLYGELLTSFIYGVEEGSDKVKILNYYVTDKEEYVTIPLDPNKSPSANIQKYYKRYNKMKTSEEMASQQLLVAEEELEYLNSIVVSISNCTATSEIDEVKKELVESGYLKKKKSKKKEKELKSSPLHFISSEGVDIYVGKNNIQNDYLTLKFASRNDIWLHTKDIPGSHVIIKNTGSIGEQTLSEGANLAAFYSKAKDSTKVPVDYTEVKNVKKPSGSKPGMVIYSTNKTYYIDPVEPKIEKIQ